MDRLVYDSAEAHCKKCGKSLRRCGCGAKKSASATAGDGIVRVRREVRRGKPVTAVIGVPLPDAELKKLAKELKKKCGSGGGSVKDGEFVLQGDHRDLVVEVLRGRGYEVKLAGG